jgi:hypothetical protein
MTRGESACHILDKSCPALTYPSLFTCFLDAFITHHDIDTLGLKIVDHYDTNYFLTKSAFQHQEDDDGWLELVFHHDSRERRCGCGDEGLELRGKLSST